jgi:HlyD family secretion protein
VGLVVAQLTRPGPTTYTLATVTSGTAVATLATVGTLTPVNQAALSFAVSGTVDTVAVTVGQQVNAGQVVATLDTTPLQGAVVTSQVNLASAQATLASDEASQTATTSSTTDSLTSAITYTAQSPVTLDSTGPSGQSGASATSGTSSAAITKLQDELVAAQHQQDADAAAAQAALATATTICTATPVPTPTTTTTTSPTTNTTDPSATTPTADPPSPPTTTPPPPTTGETCAQALAAASTAQSTLVGDIKAVEASEAALTAALIAAASSPPTGTSPGTGSPTGSQPTSGTGTSGSSTTKIKVATSQKLALDQADIDVAQSGVDSANRALASASLVSTISGTVGSVTLTAGSSSSGGQIVVIGAGTTYQLVTQIPVTQITAVTLGQKAQVTPDSAPGVLSGQVTGIGILATASSTSTTYPVTITLSSPALGLFSGAAAGVQIDTAAVKDATTVPTSAVHSQGTLHYVTLVTGNTTKQVKVTIGVVGPTLTQIKSGLTPGQQVILANLSQAVPSSSATSTHTGLTGRGAATGGFGGSFPAPTSALP